jgi:Na+-driven multidrug efflux pump
LSGNQDFNDLEHADVNYTTEKQGIKDPETFWEMLAVVVKVSVGPIVSMFFYMFVQLLNTYYVGHTNDAVLISGVGMGNMLINVLGFAIMQGLNGALETLVSRSFGLSNDVSKLKDFRTSMRQDCGKLHNRGRFVSAVVMIPIIIIFTFSDNILVAMG